MTGNQICNCPLLCSDSCFFFLQMLSIDHDLDEALEDLLALVQNKEEDVIVRNTMELVKVSYYMHNSDPLVDKILNSLTKFSARLILFELHQTVVDEDVERMQASDCKCMCAHYMSYLLPCRHMFAVRRKSGELLSLFLEMRHMEA